MYRIDGSRHTIVRQALRNLSTQITGNLNAFNDAVPHASWLRRSEIDRFTADLLRATERAPQQRAPFAMIRGAFSWATRG